jgi:WD40 repeat protein
LIGLRAVFTGNGDGLASGGVDGEVQFWDLKTGRESKGDGGHKGPVLNLVRSPDGKTLASAGADGALRAWDVAGRTSRLLAVGIGISFHAPLAFSPDGKTLAWQVGFEPVRLFAVRTGKVVRSLGKDSK